MITLNETAAQLRPIWMRLASLNDCCIVVVVVVAELKSGNNFLDSKFLESLPKEPPVLPMRKSHILRGAIPRVSPFFIYSFFGNPAKIWNYLQDFEAVDPLDKRDSFYATDGDFSLHSGTGSVGSSLAGKEEGEFVVINNDIMINDIKINLNN